MDYNSLEKELSKCDPNTLLYLQEQRKISTKNIMIFYQSHETNKGCLNIEGRIVEFGHRELRLFGSLNISFYDQHRSIEFWGVSNFSYTLVSGADQIKQELKKQNLNEFLPLVDSGSNIIKKEQ